MTKSQFLREAVRQRRSRNECTNGQNIEPKGGEKSTGQAHAMPVRTGQFCFKLDGMSESEVEMLRAQVAKQLERERRLHKARSYLYSVSRHIQLYTAVKLLGPCKNGPY